MRHRNKGAVLITLIVAFLIVSILASSAVHFAYTGLNISRSYSNFSIRSYLGDEVLEIIKAGVQDECSNILKKQYDRMLDSYSFTPASKRNLLFKEYFVDAMLEAFCTDVDLQAKFINYVNNTDASIELKEAVNTGGIAILNTASSEYDEDSMLLTIKNIRVNCSDSSGLSATVGADITIETPMIFNDRPGGFSFDSEYQDYVLIADDEINYNISATTKVSGSIYAGYGGINIGKTAASTFKVNGNYVNTRGDIYVSNGSVLTIDNKKANTLCDVIADNILIDSITNSNSPTTVDIRGNIYVADDLEVNIENATVKLSGNYVGYGEETVDYTGQGNLVDKKDNKSSAVILNKANSTLDLRSLQKMVLAGISYINPGKSGSGLNKSIATDESLTAKFMQIAYMVPSICLSTHTNPVQYDNTMTVTVDYSKSVENGGMDLDDPAYGIMSNPIILTVPGRNGTTLQYYFLRFASKAGQSKYIEDYMEFNSDYINAKAESSFKSGLIQMGEDLAYIANGNFMSYDYNNKGELTLTLMNGIATSEFLSTERERATQKAVSLNSTLMYNQTNELTDSLFETIINEDNIDRSHSFEYYTLSDLETVSMDNSKKLYLRSLKDSGLIPYDVIVYTNNDTLTVPSSMTRGLVIAYGDVNINHDFIGCIITKGKINVTAGCSLYSDVEETDEYPLLTLLINYADSDTIQGYFRNFAGLGGGTVKTDDLDVRSLVRLTNYVVY